MWKTYIHVYICWSGSNQVVIKPLHGIHICLCMYHMCRVHGGVDHQHAVNEGTHPGRQLSAWDGFSAGCSSHLKTGLILKPETEIVRESQWIVDRGPSITWRTRQTNLSLEITDLTIASFQSKVAQIKIELVVTNVTDTNELTYRGLVYSVRRGPLNIIQIQDHWHRYWLSIFFLRNTEEKPLIYRKRKQRKRIYAHESTMVNVHPLNKHCNWHGPYAPWS